MDPVNQYISGLLGKIASFHGKKLRELHGEAMYFHEALGHVPLRIQNDISYHSSSIESAIREIKEREDD